MELIFLSILALILSFNIGANNAAASMATAYGSNSISKLGSVSLIFIFVFLGSAIGGENVVKTVGKELIPPTILIDNIYYSFLIVVLPLSAILIANILRVPIATTHVVVCTIIGIGLANEEIYKSSILQIIGWWIISPLAIWLMNYGIGKYLYFKIINYLANNYEEKKVDLVLKIALISSGCFLAFFAGANNSANASATLVSLDLISPKDAALIVGFFMALGALMFGGRIIETVAKGITDICLIRAISVQLTSGVFLCIASIFGIPISLAEIITSGIIGFSCANSGFSRTIKNTHVSKMIKLWTITPILCVLISYFLAGLIR